VAQGQRAGRGGLKPRGATSCSPRRETATAASCVGDVRDQKGQAASTHRRERPVAGRTLPVTFVTRKTCADTADSGAAAG
jgi:hypothetical protein